jgi:hypothetical protein
MCKSPFVVKERGRIPETCGRRCARALDRYRAYLRGRNEAGTRIKQDIIAVAFLAARRRRHQTIIDDMLTDVPRRSRRRGTPT